MIPTEDPRPISGSRKQYDPATTIAPSWVTGKGLYHYKKTFRIKN